MSKQDTLYIAEPMFSEKLQSYDSKESFSFPPIKKIGITTGLPERREKELLGTVSPVKIAIVKAWTGLDARKVEKMLHTILGNSRLDGEYFWDGSDSLVDSVTGFIEEYHPEATDLTILDDSDVQAATEAAQKKNSQRLYTEAAPLLDKLQIEHEFTKSGRSIRIKAGGYTLMLGGKTGGRYTLTIFSKTKSTEQALEDFPDSQELSASSKEESNRRARFSMETLEVIMGSIEHYFNSHKNA